ncbi:carbohydrate ABC transporter permease [Streptomyces sp. NPDC056255]|uniref:carbohydrate ABC transporter permease n=1 Tax=Streptomyces sp. NPDC056255 TaxID=3345764 RepID=UPI0035D9BC6E
MNTLTGPRKAALLTLLLAPSFVLILAFVLGPMLGSLWISFHDWNLLKPMTWTGLDNYREVLTSADTWKAFRNTLYYVVGYLPLVYAGGLLIALGLNRAMRGRNLLRGIYFLPVVTSWVVVALVWKWILNPNSGALNAVLGWFGIDGPGWWTDPTWAMPSVILASAWKDLGFVMVILLAGLQAIPESVYEAAKVDGVTAWQRFRHVTFPLLAPSSLFVVMISLINGFQVFDQVFVMTGGGPAGATTTVVSAVYDNSFRYGKIGYASALSWVLFVVILIVSVAQSRVQRKVVDAQ